MELREVHEQSGPAPYALEATVKPERRNEVEERGKDEVGERRVMIEARRVLQERNDGAQTGVERSRKPHGQDDDEGIDGEDELTQPSLVSLVHECLERVPRLRRGTTNVTAVVRAGLPSGEQSTPNFEAGTCAARRPSHAPSRLDGEDRGRPLGRWADASLAAEAPPA